MLFPFELLVTRTIVPNVRSLWAAVSALLSKISPFAVSASGLSQVYQLASPCCEAQSRAADKRKNSKRLSFFIEFKIP